jgi:nucleotide-binding universal stress UspA family protein
MQGAFQRLVVPVSGSETDSRVLDILPDLFSKDGGTVTFLYVVEVPQSMPLDAELPAEIDSGENALRNAERVAKRVLPLRSTHVVTELLQARAVGPAIIDEAIERDAEAIVMTASIHRRHGRPTLGETTDHVLLHAPCEVVVIRTAAHKARKQGASAR